MPSSRSRLHLLRRYLGPLLLLLGLIRLFGFPASVPASENGRTFLDGIRAYQDGEYQKAVEAFGSLADAGVRNGKLYYNLANAHLKNGDPGHAILWYERALKLIPDDPDLRFNYEYARSLVKDVPEKEGLQILRVLFFWNHLLSPQTIRRTAIALNLLLWLTLGFRMIRGKRPLKGGVYILLAAALLFTGTGVRHYLNPTAGEGIILLERVSVRSGLSKAATELFVLHAGTKVTIQMEKEGFYRIGFSESKIGWVPAPAVGRI